jgi:hypothetical protein
MDWRTDDMTESQRIETLKDYMKREEALISANEEFLKAQKERRATDRAFQKYIKDNQYKDTKKIKDKEAIEKYDKLLSLIPRKKK